MEAAIVLPIIIMVIITVVLIVMFFYSQVQRQCEMHIFLRANAANITGKTVYLDDVSWDGSIHSKEQLFGGYVYGKGYLIMEDKGILFSKGTYTQEGTSHVTDGVKYVRYLRLVKGAFVDEE
ncbi:MAG: hypothetical protein KBS66_02005 [Eubacterium sp.]|nr:hypothetical protein [Candidatus Colimonas fimequi]